MPTSPIVLVSDYTNIGGSEHNLLSISEQLHQWKHPLYLITSNKGALFSKFQTITESQCIVKFPYPRKPKSWIHYYSFLKTTKAFLNKIPQSQPLHFLVGDFYPLWVILKLRKYFPTAKVSAIWQGEFEFHTNTSVTKWIRYGANEADQLIASSPVAEKMNASGLLRHPVLSLNPRSHYLDNPPPSPITKTQTQARKKLNWPTTEKIAICIGRVGKGKGQYWLTESFLNHPELYKKWRLIIVGPMDENDKPSWGTLLKNDIQNKISLLGSRNDIPELLASSHLALFPSLLNESFGLAILEAATMNIPLLTFDTGAIPYTLGKAYSGIINAHNPQNFINTWSQLDDTFLLKLQSAIPKKHIQSLLDKDTWLNTLRKIAT